MTGKIVFAENAFVPIKIEPAKNIKEASQSSLHSTLSKVKEGELIGPDSMLAKDFSNPFKLEAKIHKVYENTIYLMLAGCYVNFLASKGRNSSGNIMYLNQKLFSLKKLSTLKLENKIVVVDYLPAEYYPRLAALNVSGIVTNSLDYNLFKNIILLSTPIAVYSGFGNIPFDKKTIKIFKEFEGKHAYFDVDYNRLFVGFDKPGSFNKNYSFEYPDNLL